MINFPKICSLLIVILAQSTLSKAVEGQAYFHENAGAADFGVSEYFSDSSVDRTAQVSAWPVRRLIGHGTLTSFFGLGGSKQPQDFGVNANLGMAAQLNYSGALAQQLGIGFQIGSRVNFSGNAVQVYELLGESKDRFQNITTLGLFQRFDSGFSYGFTYDHMTQESFDSFTLTQWRLRASFNLTRVDEVGVTMNFAGQGDVGQFNSESIVLDPIEQLHVYHRHAWQSGVNTSIWGGVADKHGEENAVTGTLAPKINQILFGAEIFAPLNNWIAIYGETNLIMPADTGAVDAYLGIQIAPRGIKRSRSRQNRFRSFLPVASSTSFTVDLNRR